LSSCDFHLTDVTMCMSLVGLPAATATAWLRSPVLYWSPARGAARPSRWKAEAPWQVMSTVPPLAALKEPGKQES